MKRALFISIMLLFVMLAGLVPASATNKAAKETARTVCELPDPLPPMPAKLEYCRMGANPVDPHGYKLRPGEIVETLQSDTPHLMQQRNGWLYCIVPNGTQYIPLNDDLRVVKGCANCAAPLPTVVLEKNVIGEGSPVDFEPYTIDGRKVRLEIPIVLPPGTYTVGEKTDKRYSTTYSSDCTNGRINVTWGGKYTCTIRNEENPKPPAQKPPTPPPTPPRTTYTTHGQNLVIPYVGGFAGRINFGGGLDERKGLNIVGVEGGLVGRHNIVSIGIGVADRGRTQSRSHKECVRWEGDNAADSSSLILWPCIPTTWSDKGVESGRNLELQAGWAYLWRSGVFAGAGVNHMNWSSDFEHTRFINGHYIRVGFTKQHFIAHVDVTRSDRPGRGPVTVQRDVSWYDGQYHKQVDHTFGPTPDGHSNRVTALVGWVF